LYYYADGEAGSFSNYKSLSAVSKKAWQFEPSISTEIWLRVRGFRGFLTVFYVVRVLKGGGSRVVLKRDRQKGRRYA
jgi:hypothetical protein